MAGWGFALLELHDEEGTLHRIARARDTARIEHSDVPRRDLCDMRVAVDGDITARFAGCIAEHLVVKRTPYMWPCVRKMRWPAASTTSS